MESGWIQRYAKHTFFARNSYGIPNFGEAVQAGKHLKPFSEEKKLKKEIE